jgi:ACR3 family arsenite transporter
MSQMARQQPWWFAAGSSGLGFMAGQWLDLEPLSALIPLALLIMLFPVMLEVDWERIKRVMAGPRALILSLLVNFLFCPLLLWLMVAVMGASQPEYLVVGLVIYGLVPCGGMVPGYTMMMGGDSTTALVMVVTGLVLSTAIVPLWTSLLIETMVPVPAKLISGFLLAVIILPLAGAAVMRRAYLRYGDEAQFHVVKEKLKSMAPYGLFLMTFIVFAGNAGSLAEHPAMILRAILFAGLFLLATISFVSFLSLKAAGDAKQAVALVFGSSAKNAALSLALASTAFGGKVALVVAIAGSMVQLPLMLTYLKVGQAWFPMRDDGRAGRE